MKKMTSILSGMALVAAFGAPAFAQLGQVEVSDVNLAAPVFSAVAQDNSTAEIDNSSRTTTTDTTVNETVSTSDNSSNDSGNIEINDNVVVDATLVQVSVNEGYSPVPNGIGLGGPSITNEVEVSDAANGFSGISNVNLNSGYFNNAASQVTFGVR